MTEGERRKRRKRRIKKSEIRNDSKAKKGGNDKTRSGKSEGI